MQTQTPAEITSASFQRVRPRGPVSFLLFSLRVDWQPVRGGCLTSSSGLCCLPDRRRWNIVEPERKGVSEVGDRIVSFCLHTRSRMRSWSGAVMCLTNTASLWVLLSPLSGFSSFWGCGRWKRLLLYSYTPSEQNQCARTPPYCP